MLRKAAVHFSCRGIGSIEYFSNLAIMDLLMVANDIKAVMKSGG
ncbi:hypothetical protein [Clostridium aceticum]|nr:hypothetical protein [Clostridium aceticum]